MTGGVATRSGWLLALALLCPVGALGANPETTPMSAEAALTAGAVLAGDDPAGGGWYNPAALAALRGSSLQLGASAYSVASTVVQGALVTVLPWGTSSGDAVDRHYVSVPSVLSLSYRLRDGLGASVGVWTPAHSTFAASIVGTSGGAYPGYPLQATYQQSYSVSNRWDDTWAAASIGWQALPRLRVGASLQGAYSSSATVIDLNAAVRTSSTDPLEQGALLDVSIRGEDTMLATRAVVGLQWDATESLRLALVLRSPVVRVTGWGQATRVTSVAVLLPGTPPDQRGQAQVMELVEPGSGLSIVDVGRIYGGTAWTRGPWSVRLDGDWGPELVRVIASLRSTWNVRVGALYQVDPDLCVGAGLYRDAARGKASDGTLALDTYGISGGVDFRPAKVVKALGGGESWDMITGIAAQASFGVGKGPGMTIALFDTSGSVVPILPGQASQGFQEVPARSLAGSVSFFTSLRF
jgi:long-subunit fatty acid transport protein